MDKIKLKYFISAARNLNFTKAAEECHVVQGTISKQISAIEAELGIKLFVRKGQTLALTRAGKKLYDDSNEYLEQYQIIDNNLKKLHLAFDDKLAIAAGTMEHALIIPGMRHFQSKYTNTEINFSTYTYARMSSHFRNETLDLGFCCDTCADSIWDATKIPVHSGEWLVCAAEDSPFWDLSEEDRASFNNQTIISVHGNEYDPVYRHFLENNYKIKSFSFTNALVSIIDRKSVV